MDWKGATRTSCSATIHGVLGGVGVGPLAHTGQLLLAVHALPAGNLEGSDNALAFLEPGDFRAPFEDSATELVA